MGDGQPETLNAGQRAVLEHLAMGAPLDRLLDEIVRLIEAQAEGMLCSILTIDHGLVRHVAAPNLPESYTRVLDGAPIGPEAGSCGAAASRRQRVIVEDISTHPFWTAYKPLALPHGLRACWSSPIFDTQGEVLGTFAMYYREPRGPSATEIGWVDVATHLAALAITRARTELELRAKEERLRAVERLRAFIFSHINDVIFCLAVEPGDQYRFLSVNPAFTRATGLAEQQVVGKSVPRSTFTFRRCKPSRLPRPPNEHPCAPRGSGCFTWMTTKPWCFWSRAFCSVWATDRSAWSTPCRRSHCSRMPTRNSTR